MMNGLLQLPTVLTSNTGEHCSPLSYFVFVLVYQLHEIIFLRRHFDRITVSLGDHNVQVYDDTKNVFRLEDEGNLQLLSKYTFILQEVEENCEVASI